MHSADEERATDGVHQRLELIGGGGTATQIHFAPPRQQGRDTGGAVAGGQAQVQQRDAAPDGLGSGCANTVTPPARSINSTASNTGISALVK